VRAILLENNDDLAALLPAIFARAGITRKRVVTEEELLVAAAGLHPRDFLLLDCSSGTAEELERCSRILAATDVATFVLYRHEEDLRILRAAARGPLTALPADIGLLPLLAKLRSLQRRPYVGPAPARRPEPSAQEAAVLRLAAEGKTDAEIGQDLGIAPGTVKTYLSRLRRKWDLPTTADLVRVCRLRAKS